MTSRIDYHERAAAAFEACRQVPPSRATQWRAAFARHLEPRTGMRVLDVGAGTGSWATMLAGSFGITVVAVEPSAAMRARSACPAMIGGEAQALSLGAAAMDGAGFPPSSTICRTCPPRLVNSPGCYVPALLS